MFKLNNKAVLADSKAFTSKKMIDGITINDIPLKQIVAKIDKHRTFFDFVLTFNLNTNAFENINLLADDYYGDCDLFRIEIWNATFDVNGNLNFSLIESDPLPPQANDNIKDYLEDNAFDFTNIDDIDYFGYNLDSLQIKKVYKINNIIKIHIKPSS
jgi:hypothetical protein